MLELEQAQRRILSAIQPLPVETTALASAHGRYLAEEILAPVDLPPFDNSAMDGYALLSEEVKTATKDSPVPLRLAGRIAAGDADSSTLKPGECIRIFTGSPMPANADAVVMQEDTIAASDSDQIQILDSVKPWENVRFKGEDVKKGSVLFSPGQRVSPGAVGLLAGLGLLNVKVRRRPAIGLLATGSELREAGEPLAPGQIYESNRTTLATLLQNAGAIPLPYPLVTDSLEATRENLRRALSENDGVITTGGVSVGEMDHVRQAFDEIGGEVDFWRIAIKPGKPFVFGRWQDKSFFGLPGNPVSAIVTFTLLVRPAVLLWQGAAELGAANQTAILDRPLCNSGNRRHFMRVRLNLDGTAEGSGTQASHLLSSLAHSQGVVDVPPHTTLEKGTAISVLRWES